MQKSKKESLYARNKRHAKNVKLLSIAIFAIICLVSLFSSDGMIGQSIIGATMAGGIVFSFPKELGLTDKETAAFDAIGQSLNAELEKREKGYITEQKLKENSTAILKEYLNDSNLSPDVIKRLEDALKEQGIQIKALSEKGGVKTEFKSLGEYLKENLKDKDFQKSEATKVSMIIPVDSVLATKTTVLPNSFTTNYAGSRIPGYGQIATAARKIASLFSQFPIGADSNGVIYYTDQTTATRNAAARAVGDTAGSSVLAWTGYSQSLECISDSIPIAKEMMSRHSLLEAEIRNFIMNNLLLKEDSLLISGTGNTPEIKGIYTYATAFNSAAYTGFKPKFAGLMDLIVIMATEIMKDTNYMVDTVIINPADALGLKLEKDSNGNRINIQLMNAAGEMTVTNIRVVESASQTINTLTIGDFTKARRYYGENINLEFGYNAAGDFAKRIVTLLGTMDELLLVRNCEADAFLKSTDIATDLINVTSEIA